MNETLSLKLNILFISLMMISLASFYFHCFRMYELIKYQLHTLNQSNGVKMQVIVRNGIDDNSSLGKYGK